MSSHHPERARLVRMGIVSTLAGMAIVLLLALQEGPLTTQILTIVTVYGGLIGLLGYLGCLLMDALFTERLSRLAWLPPRLGRAGLYFVGGSLGWLAASFAARSLGVIRMDLTPRQLGRYLVMAGAISVLIGLLFYSFGLMERRLRENVERLKEAEFAEKELELARAIQQRLLPAQAIEGEGFRVSARNLPARFVAGDFYDFLRLPDGAVGIVVADVAGKGIGASLIMATVKAALPFLAAGRTAAETLREANRRLAPRLERREFVALAYLRYEPVTGRFALGNAGLPDVYRLRDGRHAEAVCVPGPRLPLGVRPEVAYEEASGTLAPGEKLLLVTDGLPEATTPSGDPLGYESLERFVATAPDLDALFASVRAATKPVIEDDWTALLLERRP